MNKPTIGWSDFASKHSRSGTGNSFTTLSDEKLIQLIKDNWENRIAGDGENGNLDRKVLVPIPVPEGEPVFFCPPRIPLKVGMPVKTKVVTRQEGEDPYIQTYVTLEDAVAFGYENTPAKNILVVCYSADALLENGGTRSTDCEWEIVIILCSTGEKEPMLPLAMARNMLEMPGGSKGEYTAQEFAEAIYFHSKLGIRVQQESTDTDKSATDETRRTLAKKTLEKCRDGNSISDEELKAGIETVEKVLPELAALGDVFYTTTAELNRRLSMMKDYQRSRMIRKDGNQVHGG